MRSTLLTTLSLVVALSLTGCVTATNYCDITSPILFGSEGSVDWINENDQPLLRDIVTHNEQWSALCGN